MAQSLFFQTSKTNAWLKNNKHFILRHISNILTQYLFSPVFLCNNLLLCQISKQKLVSTRRENRLRQTRKKGTMFATFGFEILHSFLRNTDVCWHFTTFNPEHEIQIAMETKLYNYEQNKQHTGPFLV